MDLAGVATVVGALVALFAAVSSALQPRTLESRLRRTEKLLAESTVKGLHRQMLESARDHLVERIAARELRPRYWEAWFVSAVPFLLGLVLLYSNIEVWAGIKDLRPYTIIGWIGYFWGLIGATIILLTQHAWLLKNRSKAYRRDSNPFS